MFKRKILSVSMLSCFFVASSLPAQSLLESANYLPDPSNYSSYYTLPEIENAPQLLLTQLFTQEGSNTLAIPPTSVDGYINGLLNDQALIPGFTGMSNEQLQVLGPNIITPSAFVIITTNLNPNQLNGFISSVPPANLAGILPSLTPSQLSTVVPNITNSNSSAVVNTAILNTAVSDFSANNANVFLNYFLPYVSGSQAATLFNMANIDKMLVTKLSPAAISSAFSLLNQEQQAEAIPNLSTSQLASVASLISSSTQLNFFLSNISQANPSAMPAIISNLPSQNLASIFFGNYSNATLQKQFIPNLTESQLSSIATTINSPDLLTLFLGANLSSTKLNNLITNMLSGYIGPILPSLSTPQLAMVMPNMSEEQIDWALKKNISGMVSYLSNNLSQKQLNGLIAYLLSPSINDQQETINLISALPVNQSSDIVSSLSNTQLALLIPKITTSAQLSPFLDANLSSVQLTNLINSLPINTLWAALPSLTPIQQGQVIKNMTDSQFTSLAQAITTSTQLTSFLNDNLPPALVTNLINKMSPENIGPLLTNLTPIQQSQVVPNMSVSQIAWGLENVPGMGQIITSNLSDNQLNFSLQNLISKQASQAISSLLSNFSSEQFQAVIPKLSPSQLAFLGSPMTTTAELTSFLNINLSPAQITGLISKMSSEFIGSLVPSLTPIQQSQVVQNMSVSQIAWSLDNVQGMGQIITSIPTKYLSTDALQRMLQDVISLPDSQATSNLLSSFSSEQFQAVIPKLSPSQLAFLVSPITTSAQLASFLNTNLSSEQISTVITNLANYTGPLVPYLTPVQLSQLVSNMSPSQISTGLQKYSGMAQLVVSNFSNNQLKLLLQKISDPSAILNLISNFSAAQAQAVIPNLTSSQLISLAPLITTQSQLTSFLSYSPPNMLPGFIAQMIPSSAFAAIIPQLSSKEQSQLIPNLTFDQLVSLMSLPQTNQPFGVSNSSAFEDYAQAIAPYLTVNQLSSMFGVQQGPAAASAVSLLPYLNSTQLNVVKGLNEYQIMQLSPSIQTLPQLNVFLGANVLNGNNSILISSMSAENLGALIPLMPESQLNEIIIPNMSISQIAWSLDNVPGMGQKIASNSTLSTTDLQDMLQGLTSSPIIDPQASINLVSNFSEVQQKGVIPVLTPTQLSVLSPMITTLNQLTPFLGANLSSDKLKSLVANMYPGYIATILATAAANPKDIDTQNQIAAQIIPYITKNQKDWIISPSGGNEHDIINHFSSLAKPSVTDTKESIGLSDRDIGSDVPSEPKELFGDNGNNF